MPMVIPEIGQHSRYRRQRNHSNSQNQQQPISETDPIPSIINSTRSKSTISSILFSTFSPPITSNDHPTPKKKNFTSATFRGLGCTASSQVSVPAVIRTSANWEAKKVKKKKKRGKKNKAPNSAAMAMDGATAASAAAAASANVNSINSSQPSSALSLSLSSSCVAVPDVWCGPGIGLTTDAASVDCVVSRRPVSGRGKVDGEKMNHRERPSCSVRRMVTTEDMPFLDSDTDLGMPHSRLDGFGSRHHRHARHAFPEGLAEIVMLQSNLLMGGRLGGFDQFGDWRLDVDNMSYEELLELGDKIGYVSTGLREDEISRCLRKIKPPIANKLSSSFLKEIERKCSICQEEYEADDEMGKLNCGHFYHIQCIKKWLVQKNACPVCKTAAVTKS